MPRELDDQGARARWAQRERRRRRGDGPDSDDIDDRLGALLDPARREAMSAARSELGVEAAPGPRAALSEPATQPAPVRSRGRRQGWRHRPFFYAWMLARVPAHLLFGFGYSAPRAVCVARGVTRPSWRRARPLPGQLGEAPERILFVTDAPTWHRSAGGSQSSTCRRASVEPLEAFVRRRLGLSKPPGTAGDGAAKSRARTLRAVAERAPHSTTVARRRRCRRASGATRGALPNLVVIGAQKCGTSGLHYFLGHAP